MKNRLSTLGILLTLGAFSSLHAQTMILEEKVDTTAPLQTNSFGKNSNHYVQLYTGLGLSFGRPHGGLAMGFSRNFSVGLRYKRKINAAQSLLLETQYSIYRQVFDLENSEGIFTNGIRRDSQFGNYQQFNATHQALELNIAHRFNFDWSRGNHLGVYLDLGVIGALGIAHRINAHDPLNDDATLAIKWKEQTGIKWAYGFTTALGYKQWSIWGRYYPEGALAFSDQSVWRGAGLQPYQVGLSLSIN